jgi:hypothetical protein
VGTARLSNNEQDADLWKFGFEEGEYEKPCRICSEIFMGRKVAWNCRSCAMKEKERQMEKDSKKISLKEYKQFREDFILSTGIPKSLLTPFLEAKTQQDFEIIVKKFKPLERRVHESR